MAEWECPICSFINPATTRICQVCDYNLDTGVQSTSVSAAPSSAAPSSAAPSSAAPSSAAPSSASTSAASYSGPKEINGDELFNIPRLSINYKESNRKKVDRFIAELRIPVLRRDLDDPPPSVFSGIIYERFNLMEIYGLSNLQRNEIAEINEGPTTEPYNPLEWNNNESLDYFIAKEFPTCPENTYIARDPELSTLCRRILEEEGREGFIIGEQHYDYTPKKFLIDNMAELRRCGVTHLFLEHFFYNTLIQRDLREGRMTNILNQTLDYKYHGSKGGYDFRELILSAWANNITVIGIDTDRSYTIGKIGKIKTEILDRKARVTAMNYVTRKIINDEKQGKFVALIGSAHLSKIPGECLGVADIFNVPSILFDTSKEGPPIINARDLNHGDIILSRVDYVYYSKEKRRANFKGGRRSRRSRRSKQIKKKNRLSFRHRKTKLK
jgi:hypothetical protein